MEKISVLFMDKEVWIILFFILLQIFKIKYIRWFRRYGDEFKPRDKRHPLNIIGRIVHGTFLALLLLLLIVKIVLLLDD